MQNEVDHPASRSWNFFENTQQNREHQRSIRYDNPIKERKRGRGQRVAEAILGPPAELVYRALNPNWDAQHRKINDASDEAARNRKKKRQKLDLASKKVKFEKLSEQGVEKNPGPPKVEKKWRKKEAKVVKKILKGSMKKAGMPLRKKKVRVRTNQNSKSRSYIMPAIKSVRSGAAYNSFTAAKVSGMQTIRIAGRCIILQNLVPTAGTIGTVLATISLNPTTMQITRLSSMAPYYQRFWCTKMNFKLQTGLPQNETGAIAAFWNSDPLDNIRNTNIALRLNSASQRPGFKVYNVWHEDMTWSMPALLTRNKIQGHTTNELFYTDSFNPGIPAQLVSQGSFNLIVNNTLGSAATASLGNLICEYEFQMYLGQDDTPTPPAVSPSLYQASTATCTVASPFIGLVAAFNTSPITAQNISTASPSFVGWPNGVSRWKIVYHAVGTAFLDTAQLVPTGVTGTTLVQTNFNTGHNEADTTMTANEYWTVQFIPGLGNEPRITIAWTGATTVSSLFIELIAMPLGSMIDEGRLSVAPQRPGIHTFWVGHPDHPEYSRERVRSQKLEQKVTDELSEAEAERRFVRESHPEYCKGDQHVFEPGSYSCKCVCLAAEISQRQFLEDQRNHQNSAVRGWSVDDCKRCPSALRLNQMEYRRDDQGNCNYCKKKMRFDRSQSDCKCLEVPEADYSDDDQFPDDESEHDYITDSEEKHGITEEDRQMFRAFMAFTAQCRDEEKEKENKKEVVCTQPSASKKGSG